MRKWYAVFVDSSRASGLKDEELELRAGDLKHFETAAKASELNGREIYGMWIIDHGTEQEDVIKIDRNVPPEIRARHIAYLMRQQ